jgi:hypothetical protein
MFLAERFVTRRKFSYALAACAVFALQLLAGHPTFAVVTIVATTVYIVCRVLQRSWRRSEPLQLVIRKLAGAVCQWGGAIALGIGLAAIQFLPQLLHVNESIRQGGLRFEYATSLPAQMRYLPQLIFPYEFVQGDWLKQPTPWGSELNVVPSSGIYIGSIAVLLPILALWWHRRWPDPGWSLAAGFLVALGLALGDKTPLFPALWSLPGLNGLRYPHRFLLWASFCLACLSALGLHRVLARSRLGRLKWRDSIPFLLVTGAVVLLGIVFWTQASALAAAVQIAPDFRFGLLISLALFGTALVLFGALFRTRRLRNIVLGLITLFVIADLWIFRDRSGYAPAVTVKEALAPPEVIRFFGKERDPFRVMSLIPDDRGLNRNRDLSEFLQADTSALWGIDSADVFFSLFSKRYFALREAIVWELLHSSEAGRNLAGFLGGLNVKYVVAPNSVELRDWKRVYQTARASTWQNPAFLPRAFLVGKVVSKNIQVDNQKVQESIKRMDRYYKMVSNWGTRMEDAQIVDNIMADGIDYRTTAVVEGAGLPQLNGNIGKSEVISRPQETDKMSFEVNSDNPALLVISNNYYPGWSATVNGQPAKIFRTNYTSMGILVPKGHSEVVLDFVTPGFRLGAVISAISIVLCAVGLLAPRMRELSWAVSRGRKMRAVPARNP